MTTMFGPDVTFLGIPRARLDDPTTLAGADAVIIGAPFDGGTSYRPGARFGPSAIRSADVDLLATARPHIALGVDPLSDLRVVDAGDVFMPSGQITESISRLEEAVSTVVASGAIPVVLGGDHTIALPDIRGVAKHHGKGRVGVIHFDAHTDTADFEFGSKLNHATPMRRLIEAGTVRGDRFVQIGLRGYWPGPDVFAWMAEQGMRWYEMSEIGRRGLDGCLDEAFSIVRQDCDGIFLTVDIDVVDPAMAPGTGTPEPGGLTSRQVLDAVRRCALELPILGMDMVEVAPAYDMKGEVTAYLANRIVLEILSGIAKQRKQLPRA
jgi:agmatinase